MGFYHPLDEKLEQIDDRLSELTLMLKDKQRSNPDQVFFDTQEFLQIMNVSKRTAQYWRDSGLIGFCQIGYKIYYRLSDILELLDKNFKAPINGK
jgi:hypothetical protein